MPTTERDQLLSLLNESVIRLQEATRTLQETVREMRGQMAPRVELEQTKRELSADIQTTKRELTTAIGNLDDDVQGIKTLLSRLAWLVLTPVILAVVGLVLTR